MLPPFRGSERIAPQIAIEIIGKGLSVAKQSVIKVKAERVGQKKAKATEKDLMLLY